MVELVSLILIAVIILSIILLLVLLLPKSLLSRLKRKNPTPTTISREYTDKVKQINKSKIQLEIKLDQINEIAKDFFSKAFHLNQNLNYTELTAEFKKRKIPDASQFSDLMLKAYYSGQKITKENLDKLEVLLINIINKNSHLLEKEKPKSQIISKVTPFLEKLEQKPEHNRAINEINHESRKVESLRKNAEDLLHNLLRIPEFEKITEHKIKKKELNSFVKQHRKHSENLRRFSQELNNLHKEFNSLFTNAFKNGSKFQKKQLERLSKEWKKEDKELKKVINPFRKLLISIKVINKYAAKLKFIIIHQSIQLNQKFSR